MKYFSQTVAICLTVFSLIGIFLSSCVGAVQMFPEETQTPTSGFDANPTPSPIPTNTPQNTSSPEPASTASPQPTQESMDPIATARQPLRQGGDRYIDEGGFSFQPIIGCEDTYLPGQATLSCEDTGTIILMMGAPFSSTSALEDILNNIIEFFSGTFQTFEAESPYPFTVSGSRGLAAKVTGELGGTPILGRVVIVVPTEEQLFYALGITADGPAEDSWEPNGRQVFEAVINSIEFFKPIIDRE